jgi:hypothetical protein
MIKFLRLTFLRPFERFLAQWISVSTEPSAFVRERIRLGDTTNFLKQLKRESLSSLCLRLQFP